MAESTALLFACRGAKTDNPDRCRRPSAQLVVSRAQTRLMRQVWQLASRAQRSVLSQASQSVSCVGAFAQVEVSIQA